MEIQRQSDQWNIRKESSAVQGVDLEGLTDLLGGRSIMAGLHQAAPAFNVPRLNPNEARPDPSWNPDATSADWSKFRHVRDNPASYDPQISGGPNPNRAKKGPAPVGDRGLGDVAWAAGAPGFDLEQDGAARTDAARGYADRQFAEEPWTVEEENYGNPDKDFYVQSPDEWIDTRHRDMDHRK